MRAALIGFGDIAPKHLEVLKNHNCDVVALVTKKREKAIQKASKYNFPATYDSILDIPIDSIDFFLLMVNPEFTSDILRELIPLKKPILVEKPVSFGTKQISELIELKNKYNCPIMVGMNRRFYSIFHQGLEFLKEKNKKLDAISIEAPERFSDIMLPKFNEITRQNWMFCNPVHCIDLIRFFGGDVKEIKLNSLPQKYFFNAIGTLDNNTKFSYMSNWKSPGSWNVTLYAESVRITFNPLEKGIINENGKVTEIFPSQQDISFKPGFDLQLEYFIKYLVKKNKITSPMCSLEDHKKTLELIEKIFCL